MRKQHDFNLARVLLDKSQPAQAAPLLEELHRRFPKEAAVAIHLAHAYYATGQLANCRQVVEQLLADEESERPRARLYMGALCFAEGKTDEALDHLLAAEKTQPRLPGLHCQIGRIYLRKHLWSEAQRAFAKTLAIDPDSAKAHDGLASALLGLHRYQEAAEEALLAVGLLHYFPHAHFHLGAALAKLGMNDRAILAFETCLAIQPGNLAAHQWLADLYGQDPARLAQAIWHRHIVNSAGRSGPI